MYFGDSNNKSQKVSKIYWGDNSGLAGAIAKGYYGDENGIARLFFSSKATYALLYSDGSMYFQLNKTADINKTLSASYNVKPEYINTNSIPWYNNMQNIKNVTFKDDVPITSLAYYMNNARGLTSVNYGNLNMENITNITYTYYNCFNLTGSPICGNNVTNMYGTYSNCNKLTGSPVCGSNVTDMGYTYSSCYNLTGSPVCGDNVIHMYRTYENCYNLSGNSYFYSPQVANVGYCFYNRNTSSKLSLYVPSNSTTLTTCLINNDYSMVGKNITWTDDITTNGCYYNTEYNIYIYPVANVAEARVANGD